MIPYLLNLESSVGTPPIMASASGILLYPDPGQRGLAARFVNTSGQSLDLGSGLWGDDAPSVLALRPLVTVAAVPGWQVCAVPTFPPNSGPVAVFIHLAGGGPPVDAPFAVSAPGPAVLFGVAYAQ